MFIISCEIDTGRCFSTGMCFSGMRNRATSLILHCSDGSYLVSPHTVTSMIKSMHWTRGTSEAFCTYACDVEADVQGTFLYDTTGRSTILPMNRTW